MSKIALVTGAGTGIGRASALALAQSGWTVVLTGRRKEPLEETVIQAGERAGAMQVVPCDVTRPDQVGELFEAIRADHGRLDMAFNNAGAGTPALDLAEMSWDQWKAVIDVNLNGAFLIAKGAFTCMRDQRPQGGRIINNGSISAHVPRPGSAAYTASKHAITGLTRSISLDGRKYDIVASQIDIGNAVTPMTERMAEGVLQADGSVSAEPRMDVAHVGDAIVQMANLPLEANVLFMTIMASKMPFVGRG